MSDLHQYDIRKYDFHTKKFHLLLFVYSLIFGIVIVAPLYGHLRPSNPLVVLSIAIDSIAMYGSLALLIITPILRKFFTSKYIDNLKLFEYIGVCLAGAIAMAVICLAFVGTVLGGILLCYLLYKKWDRVKATVMNIGFGQDICIYTIWIVGIGLLIQLCDEMDFNSAIFLFLIIGIIGLFRLPKYNQNAKKAAPFILFIVTLGILFAKLALASSDNNEDGSIDVTPDIASVPTNDINSSINLIDTNIANATPIIDNSINNVDNIINNTSIASSINSNDINNNVDFNTPTQDSTSTINVTSADFINQTTINTDTDTITGSENQTLGSIEQDGNNTIIKDNMGNTVLSKDETTGFIYDEEGKPQGIVDNNGDIKTYYDVNTGETKIADNETIYNNEGKIEGHIQKK
ncbi:hypothetical protein ACTQX2_02210 [Megamonas funiformis]|uniref:hypothetical protein n=1 Tax=Megamonas funiformis TaxID=437897 RepID=UPI003F9AE67A